MNNQVQNGHMTAQVREAVIAELRAEGLTPEQQNTLIQEVGEALLERATIALLRRLPPEKMLEMAEKEDGAQSAEETMRMISQHVPEAEEVIKVEIQEGIRAYQSYLDKAGK